MNFTKKKVTVVVASTAVFALGAGAAYAYWTSTGNGVASGSTDHSTAFTFTSAPVVTNTLSPGGPTQTIAFTVHNPSSGYQNLSAVTATVAGPLGVAWSAGTAPSCTSLDFQVGTPAITVANMPPGGTIDGTVTLQMIDTGLDQNSCQDLASVPLYLHAS
jgi:hypothetical protein